MKYYFNVVLDALIVYKVYIQFIKHFI